MKTADFLKSCYDGYGNGYDVPYPITYGGNILELWLNKLSPDERGTALVEILAAEQYDTPGILNLLETYDWQTFSGTTWSLLLSIAPQYAGQCNWRSLSNNDWNILLKRQPQFIDQYNLYGCFKNLESQTWISILCYQPQWANKCDQWEGFSAGCWAELLSCQPAFANRCLQWNHLKREWGKLLSKQPQFADKCDKWNCFSSGTWIELLSEQPQFADKCDKWNFSSLEWSYLLARQPQFADKCQWEKLNETTCIEILKADPVFIDRCVCKAWSGKALKTLFELFPDFDLNKIDLLSWARLCAAYPEFSCDCPWDNFHGRAWSILLRDNPAFATQCAWEKLDKDDWLILLAQRPEFAARCPYLKQMSPRDWAEQLAVAPELETLYNQVIMDTPGHISGKTIYWEYFSSEEWLLLLDHQPQFYRYCDRRIFSPEEWTELVELQSVLICECENDELTDDLLLSAIQETDLPDYLFIDYMLSDKEFSELTGDREGCNSWLKFYPKRTCLIGKSISAYIQTATDERLTSEQIIAAASSENHPSRNTTDIFTEARAFVEQQNKNAKVIGEIVTFQHTCNDIEITIALQYHEGTFANIYSSTNGLENIESGTHLNGFRIALLRVFNSYIKANDFTIQWEDASEGLSAAINIQVPKPKLGGQTQTRLDNVEVSECVETFFLEAFKSYLEQHPETAKLLCDRVTLAVRAREAARRARESSAW